MNINTYKTIWLFKHLIIHTGHRQTDTMFSGLRSAGLCLYDNYLLNVPVQTVPHTKINHSTTVALVTMVTTLW